MSMSARSQQRDALTAAPGAPDPPPAAPDPPPAAAAVSQPPDSRSKPASEKMAVQIRSHSHGKAAVKLLRLQRDDELSHSMKKFSVEVKLHGSEHSGRSFTSADNSGCVATDSMKNTVYVLAQRFPLCPKEEFASLVADHFVTTYPDRVARCEVSIEEEIWERVVDSLVSHKPHAHAWKLRSGSNDVRWTKAVQASVMAEQSDPGDADGATVLGAAPSLTSGVRGMTLLKSTQSGWAGFVRDEYTSLPDVADRILASAIDIQWDYRRTDMADIDYDTFSELIERILVHTLVGHHEQGVFSPSVQTTVHDMAKTLLSKHGDVLSDVKIFGPNLHHIPFDFSKVAEAMPAEMLPDKPEVFIATSEPRGIIEIKMRFPESEIPYCQFDSYPKRLAEKKDDEEPKKEFKDDMAAIASTTPAHRMFLESLGIRTRDQFLARFHGIYEKSPWILQEAWPRYVKVTDFQNAFDFFLHLRHVVEIGGRDKQYALLRAHPDLAGKCAIATFTRDNSDKKQEKLTAESQKEQTSAGLNQCTPEEYAKFQDLNDKYAHKFWFPFILAVSGRTRAQILEIFETRMRNTVEQEFAEAIRQVHRIAEIRVRKILGV